jgi:hypothetical protein
MNARKYYEMTENMKHELSLFSVCVICRDEIATQIHHKFSQTKHNIKLYGNLIHHPDNLQAVCHNCHMNRAHHLSEREFCDMLSIQPRGKSIGTVTVL